jgi:hypothetical protein
VSSKFSVINKRGREICQKKNSKEPNPM